MGANPSWQKTLVFSRFTPGKVNRAVKEQNYPSGKGVNFCRALRCSGLAEMILFQFAGGINGERLCDGLDAESYPHTTIVTEAETRCCITCLDDSGYMTELIGTSRPVTDSEEEQFLSSLRTVMPRASIFAITGSLPDGSDPALYYRAAKIAFSCNVPILMDALSGVKDVLSLPGKVILKVNQEEFFKITGVSEITSAHQQAAKMYPEKIFAVTNGKDRAVLSYGGNIFYYTLPEIDVVSPLGAGDTASAVMSALTAMQTAPEEAFKLALAAASANCMNDTAGEFLPEESFMLAEKIYVEKYKLGEL